MVFWFLSRVKSLWGDCMFILADWGSSRFVLFCSFWRFFTIKKPRDKHAKWPPSDLTPWTLTLVLSIQSMVKFEKNILSTNVIERIGLWKTFKKHKVSKFAYSFRVHHMSTTNPEFWFKPFFSHFFFYLVEVFDWNQNKKPISIL